MSLQWHAEFVTGHRGGGRAGIAPASHGSSLDGGAIAIALESAAYATTTRTTSGSYFACKGNVKRQLSHPAK